MGPLSIATVIVTWNRCADLLKAINSLKGQTYPLTQIIVVDNGSSDETVTEVQRLHPDVLMIPLGENTGACHGRNMGTREVRCGLAFYIDDDVTLEPDCIEEMVGVFQAHPEVGAVQATVIDPWSDPDPARDRTLRHCPHPREGAFTLRMDLMPKDPWPLILTVRGRVPGSRCTSMNMGLRRFCGHPQGSTITVPPAVNAREFSSSSHATHS